MASCISPPSSVHIVLDIDGVLCCHHTQSDQDRLFYLRKGAILTVQVPDPENQNSLVGRTHYIFPGVIEFLTLLYKTLDGEEKVSFFSSGTKERNVSFVQELLHRVFPAQEQYNKVLSKTKICSREDLTPIEDWPDREKSPFRYSKMIKDLRKIHDSADLTNIILADDNPPFAAPGQIKNLLFVPPMNHSAIYRWDELEFHKGNMKNLCVEMNRTYYLAGVFFAALEQSQQEEVPITHILHRFQFIGETFNQQIVQIEDYYEMGLQKLQTVNPELDFLAPHSSELLSPATPEETAQLQAFRGKEYQDV